MTITNINVAIDRACVRPFRNDLCAMTNDEVAAQIKRMSERIENDKAWLDALLAESRIRKRLMHHD